VQGATALLQQVRMGRGNNVSSWLVELLKLRIPTMPPTYSDLIAPTIPS